MTHSHEPWTVGKDACDDQGFIGVYIMSSEDSVGISLCRSAVADKQGYYDGYTSSPDNETGVANRERIVACVNACVGVSTERLINSDYTIVLRGNANETT